MGSRGPAMDAGLGPLGRGDAVTLRVRAVGLRPDVPLLRLWGLLGERKADYARLHREIQAAAGPRLAARSEPGGQAAGGVGLCPGELGLVEMLGLWYRCCVVSCSAQGYRVFLLDEGYLVATSACYLARGCPELFQLPPEVLGCVVANVMPSQGPEGKGCGDSPVSKWTVEAMEFLSFLHGKEVSGVVQEVMSPQLIVLELPQLVAQMQQLGLARRVSPVWFYQVLRRCLPFGHLKQQLWQQQPSTCSLGAFAVPQLLHVLLSYRPLSPALDYFYPQLQLGVTEPVLVTHVSDPHHIYCQLQCLSQEIRCLSDTMCHVYDRWEQDLLPKVGSPCAARGTDGQWYRALLLELITGEQDQQAALVIFVDYGRKETVTRANLRHLPAECFQMPVVTYVCALQGVSDGGCGWSSSQIDVLKALVQGRGVSARIKAFNSFEHLYYVTLYGESGVNLNHLFGSQACCLVSSCKQVSQTEARGQLGLEGSSAGELELPSDAPPVLTHRDLGSAGVPGVQLKTCVFYSAQVSYLRDPSEFWLQLNEHHQLFRQLRQCMWNFYSHATKLDGAGWDPHPGSLCCASGNEGGFYRAVVTRVLDSGVEIYLVDRGSTETVDRCAVKDLLPRFREVPALALKCCLAGVSPLRGAWSEASVSAFREIVLNKGLKVWFLSLKGDKYMVEIFDQTQLGEKRVSKLMAQGGYAEYQRCEISKTLQNSDEKAVTQASSLGNSAEEKQINAEKRLREESALKSNDRAVDPDITVMVRESPVAVIHSSKSSESLPTQEYKGKGNLHVPLRQNYVEIKPGYSCGGHLEVGSTVSVNLSYVENPSVFWCQLSRNSHDLELLMDEIQEHCKNSSQPHVWPNLVCLAQYSEDKKWYRALIVSEALRAEKVEVVYVDYGNREQVYLSNLRAIDERFLRLEAQAFRCSLYNLIQPNGQNPFAWEEEAIKTFQQFVVNSSSELELKCTIFALASINRDLFNIVDLITPFQSACQFLTQRGVARPLFPQKHLASLVQLHSYYYSNHGIKIGSEEEVYITHIEDPWTFYCQLERCADTLAQLADNISHLSETMTSTGTLRTSGSLCLARYADSQWYRGVIMEAQPKAKVFFVDFGNTETVEEDDLLPLPSDASDILLVPMQAIKCSISDVSSVSKEAATWFKEAVLERQLKAIVVAKDSDNTLLVELFDSNTQINTKLKELSLNNATLCSHVESGTQCSRNGDVNETAVSPLNAGRPLESKKCGSEAQGGQGSKRHFKEDVNLFQPSSKGDLAAGLLESDEMLSSKKDAILLSKAGEESLLSIQMDTRSDIKSGAEGRCVMLKNVSDLPQQKIVPAHKTLVYVSYVNDPLDFYVQLGSDEVQLNSILESLNNGTPAKNPCGQFFQAGDLISAVYSEDNLWYRAAVKEKTSDNSIRVHYIDYGDTSVISVHQARRLPEDLSSIPAISIHCFLGGLKCKKNTDWAEKTVLYFTKRTSEILLSCEFVEKVEDKWEVILSDHQGIITVDLPNDLASTERSCSTEIIDKRENSDMITSCEPLPSQAPSEVSCDCKSFIWKFPEAGQTLKIYITVVNGPEYFWCHSADTEHLSYIDKKIEEAEKLGLSSLSDGRISCIKGGHTCLAKYSQDGWFYRAQIVSVKGDSVVVRHVDYGSQEAVGMEMVRQIPCELLRVPGQAFACCLSGFSASEGSWLSEANQKFYNMTADLVLEAEVVETQKDKDSEVPLCVVKLEASGNSINEEMKPFWKANKGTGDSAFSSLDNLLKENRSSNSDMGLCLERETTAVCGLAQEGSALLRSEPFLGVTSECLETAEANVSVGAASGNADDGYETAEHQNSFDKEVPLSEGDSDNSMLLEPMRCCSPHISGSEVTASEQELSEVLFGEDAELQAELTGSASAANLFLGNKPEELQQLPVLQAQPSSSEGTGMLVELDPLEMHYSYDDLKEFLLDLEALSAKSSFSEETKEALETKSLEVQTASGSETRETVLEQELLELPVCSEETGELAALNFLEILTLLNEKENLVPSVSDGKKSEEPILPVVQPSLGGNPKKLRVNLSGIHQAEDLLGDWMEADAPPLRLSSSGGRPEKQLDLKTHDKQSVVSAKFGHFLELVLPDVQPSQEDREEDLLELEHAVLQNSANSGSQLSFLTKDSVDQRPVFPVKSCDYKVKKRKGRQKQQDDCVEEWMKQDLTDSFKECGNTHGQSSGCKSGDEEEEKQNENLADCSAAHPEYPCNLKGFAVGSKCVVWTSLQWCEARILEISEKGTRVLNLSSGSEEIVAPENVWNGIPDSACGSSEALTSAAENFQSLPEESLLHEKQTGHSCDLVEDICALQHC
ncbi:tudor domain-containing protein 6 isoform X1 [Corapipo altera]|uniref:tudor domain-containing protein 6 isoform X1 n=1 Tax=Corapipo altera TaxID=415028 RepID=UPI000FD63BBC|nr:tudor domain-containing protein 6 isoform X1 [Corapipo altera]